ncbi:MAG: hypothetical protein IJU16_05630 [Clostridia bacterium]|nr:hypothetical protein [Clostridia bacterium]
MVKAKHLLAIVACLALLMTTVFSVISFQAAADNGVTFTVETKNVSEPIKAGETFTLSLSSSAVDAIAVIEAHLLYDGTVAKAINMYDEDVMDSEDDADTKSLGYLRKFSLHAVNTDPSGKVTDSDEVSVTGMVTKNKSGSGDIAIITFEALQDITDKFEVTIYNNAANFMAGYIPADGGDTIYYDVEAVDGGVFVEGAADETTTTEAETTTTEAETTTTEAETTTTEAETTTTEAETTTTQQIQDDADVTFTVETVTVDQPVKAGETFTIKFSSSKVDAIAVIEAHLLYDGSVAKAINMYDEDAMDSEDDADTKSLGYLRKFALHSVNTDPTAKVTESDEVSVTGMVTKNKSGEGDIAIITFEALQDINDKFEVTIFTNADHFMAGYIPADGGDTQYYSVAGVDGGLFVNGAEPATTTTEPETTTTEAETTTTEAETTTTEAETTTTEAATTTTEAATTTTEAVTTTTEAVTTTTEAVTTTTEGEVTTTTEAATTTTEGEGDGDTDKTTQATGVTDPGDATNTTKAGGEGNTTKAGDEGTTTATNATQGGNGPKTGEEDNVMLYILLAGMAAAAVALSTVVLKKKAN